MTVCVALVTPAGCYMGADSAVISGDLYSISETPKVANVKGTLIGFAGGWKVGAQAMKKLQRMPQINIELFAREFLTDEKGWELLIVHERRVYYMDEDKSLIEVRSRDHCTYGSIGTGQALALGSLYADHIDNGSVMTALRAAEAHTVGIKRPFTLVEA